MQADFDATIQSFEKYYCDLADNNRGMEAQCGEGPKELEDVNKDIDLCVLGYPLTLNVDFRDGEIGGQPMKDMFKPSQRICMPANI